MKRRGFFRLLTGAAAVVAAPAIAVKRKVKKWFTGEEELVHAMSEQIGEELDREILKELRKPEEFLPKKGLVSSKRYYYIRIGNESLFPETHPETGKDRCG